MSPSLQHCAQALLARLEARVVAKGVAAGNCAPLLRRLFPRTPPGRALERYPARIFLCAYMVVAHPGGRARGGRGWRRGAGWVGMRPRCSKHLPKQTWWFGGQHSCAPPRPPAEVVFNSQGEREASLASAARGMLVAFEPLLARLAEAQPAPPRPASEAAADADAAGGDMAEADETAPMAAPLAAMLQVQQAWGGWGGAPPPHTKSYQPCPQSSPSTHSQPAPLPAAL